MKDVPETEPTEPGPADGDDDLVDGTTSDEILDRLISAEMGAVWASTPLGPSHATWKSPFGSTATEGALAVDAASSRV